MATLSELQAQLEKIRDLRAGGVSRISVRSAVTSREVEHRSDAELAAAAADIERQIAALTRGRVHTIKIASSKGF